MSFEMYGERELLALLMRPLPVPAVPSMDEYAPYALVKRIQRKLTEAFGTSVYIYHKDVGYKGNERHGYALEIMLNGIVVEVAMPADHLQPLSTWCAKLAYGEAGSSRIKTAFIREEKNLIPKIREILKLPEEKEQDL